MYRALELKALLSKLPIDDLAALKSLAPKHIHRAEATDGRSGKGRAKNRVF
jgi:hypothetical protein